jgi:GrpB-like predicted nucleotidyltransferase (UPF0157 family)
MTDTESLAQAIDEEVRLSPYDPVWPSMFEIERERITALCSPHFLDVQHIGSTAVPGTPSKPVIDIMAGIVDMSVAEKLMRMLLDCGGYVTSEQFNATLSDRLWLMRHANGRRTHHLHIVVHGGAQWRLRLNFRNALRSNYELAARYHKLKITLADQIGYDREEYTRAKKDFVLAFSGA